MIGAERAEVIFESGIHVAVGKCPIQVRQLTAEPALETDALGLIDVGKQSGGAASGLKQDVIPIGGVKDSC